nr:PREDICTED: uncharacterized protein LOC109040028 isoform X1 [Bemisia tabaci]
MSAEDNSWRSPPFRQNVVQKIEEAVRSSGMTPSRNSLEMENHVYQKAKTKEEYLGFVARLILHVREIDRCRFPSFIENTVCRKTPETAEEVKENGNVFFTRKMYNEALIFYNKAIQLNNSSAPFFGNRSACYMMLGNYSKAAVDASSSILIDPAYIKGHVRLLKCYIALGEVSSATETLQKIQSMESVSNSVQNEVEILNTLKSKTRDVLKAMESKNYAAAIPLINTALSIAPASSNFNFMKAECHVHLHQFNEAKTLANKIKEVDQSTSVFICGLCFYYEGNIEMAITCFETSNFPSKSPNLQKSVDFFKKALEFRKLKSEGNQMFERGQLAAAYELYSKGLNIDPTNKAANSKLYFNRGTVNFRLNKLKDAVLDFSQAIDFDNNYFKALTKRGQCYIKLNEYEKAVYDFEKVFKNEPTYENKKMLDDAKAMATQSKRKDYYRILGLAKTASSDEIKKAYRKLALVHHPDRHVNSSETEKVNEEKKFKELGEAYAVLSDPVKKVDYDRTILLYNAPTHRYTHTHTHPPSAPTSAGPSASVFMSRATAFWKTGSYTQAREAAMEAISRDPLCIGAYLCILKCHIATGDIGSAESLVSQLRRNHRLPNNVPDLKILQRLKHLNTAAEKHLNNSQHLLALRLIKEARDIAPASIVLKLWAAECLLYLKQELEAKKVLETIGLAETHYLAPHLRYVSGLLHYLKCEFDQAIFILSHKGKPSPLLYAQRCEELAQRAKNLKLIKESANDAYSKVQYDKAIALYTQALRLDPRLAKYNSVIFANRGAAHFQLKNFKACISDCSQALRQDPSYQKALLRRAQCHTELQNYTVAHRDYSALYSLSQNPEHKDLMLRSAELAAHNKSVVNVDSDEDDSIDISKIKKSSRQTKMGEYIGKNLRKRTRQNYKVDSGSENNETDSEKASSPKKSKNSSSDEETVSNEEVGSKSETTEPCSSKKPSEKTCTSKSTKKPAKKTVGNKKGRNARKVKCVSSSESESSAEASIQSMSESESSDSEEIFVKKTIGKKRSKVTIDSDSDVDLSEIKNSYRTRVISSKKKFSEYKYKKVVGGGRKK